MKVLFSGDMACIINDGSKFRNYDKARILPPRHYSKPI